MAKEFPDTAYEETEKILSGIEKRIKAEYQQAIEEVQAKAYDYMQRFEAKDRKWREWVANGQKTKKEYEQWRAQQILVGERWQALEDTLAHDLYNVSVTAQKIAKEGMPEVYAVNFNYGTYEVEKGSGKDTGFTLYNKDAIERILRDDPDILPGPGRALSAKIAEGKAVRWNKQQIQSVMIQGIMQGESIPKLAKRLGQQVGESDYKASIRNARTMTTGVQNAGRCDAYKRGESMGIKMIREWRSVLDLRTRHEHRLLDGQKRGVDEPFEVDGIQMMYPGDLSSGAPGYMIYNCRCKVRAHAAGFNGNSSKYRDNSALMGMSYDEWKQQKRSESQPILSQYEKGKAIEESYKREYRNGPKKKKR